MEELMLQVDHVSKQYKLGQIGGTTLQDELQRWRAKLYGKEDPTKLIGARSFNKGETFLALDNISFDVKRGERVGIIGHNGAGKSTLLKLISRVTAPSGGRIGMNGRVASMLEVGTGFHPELTGRENIYMNGAILGMKKKEIDDKLEDIIEFSECRQFIDTPVKRYSSGMYVKLAFSVAAHLDSEIMIMDEVLAVGDMAFQKKCLDKMNDVSKTEGRTILYVSHNMNTIRQLCDRCIVLDHGRITFDGDVEEGISLYMSYGAETNDLCLDYSQNTKLRNEGGNRICFETVEYVDQTSQYKANSLIPIRLVWKNHDNVNHISLRIEIRRHDRSIIGTAFLYDFYSGVAEETGDILVGLDVSCLVPGSYATTYTLFERNQFGANVNLDNVKGLNFEIIDEDSEIVWDKTHWGNVKFPGITLLKE